MSPLTIFQSRVLDKDILNNTVEVCTIPRTFCLSTGPMSDPLYKNRRHHYTLLYIVKLGLKGYTCTFFLSSLQNIVCTSLLETEVVLACTHKQSLSKNKKDIKNDNESIKFHHTIIPKLLSGFIIFMDNRKRSIYFSLFNYKTQTDEKQATDNIISLALRL